MVLFYRFQSFNEYDTKMTKGAKMFEQISKF